LFDQFQFAGTLENNKPKPVKIPINREPQQYLMETILEKLTYTSYLIKLWLVKQNGKLSWLASLEDPHTGQQINFNCFEDLSIFFQQLKKDLESKIKLS